MKDLIRKNWKWIAVCVLSNVLQWLSTDTPPADVHPTAVNPSLSPSTNPIAE